jgi:hypothetical protein
VEHDAVIEAFARQFDDARDVAGGQIGAQLDHDVAGLAVAGVEGEGEGFGHVVCLLKQFAQAYSVRRPPVTLFPCFSLSPP